MHKIYHLSTCNTCQRIIKELGISEANFRMQDIKTEAITEAQLQEMFDLAGSYEALFTRRSMKYRAWNLAEKTLGETDYRDLILKEYTFLKRPVLLVDGKIFIGNAKKTVAEAAAALVQ